MGTMIKKMTRDQALELKNSYNNYEEKKTPPYAMFQIRVDDTTITAYESGKVVFQGPSIVDENKTDNKKSSSAIFPQAGSDEVGTGDYFGPVVVCACYVSKQDALKLKSYNIQDSKQIKDSEIMELGPILTSELTHSLQILENNKYNIVHQSNNLNAIKAKMHNQAFIHLQSKLGELPMLSVIDQFSPPKTYYRYLDDQPVVIRSLVFETKAENKFISVACAAIIARYHFLMAFEQMSNYFEFQFPKGAGKQVDQAIKDFVEKYDREELSRVAKVHFINTVNVLD